MKVKKVKQMLEAYEDDDEVIIHTSWYMVSLVEPESNLCIERKGQVIFTFPFEDIPEEKDAG